MSVSSHRSSALLCVLFALFFCRYSDSQCLQNSCPKLSKDQLNVHIVAHTHDDLGWLKTVDQYFWGLHAGSSYNGKEAVQYILDTVVEELKRNPQRRFIYVETGYFWRWWMLQTEETRTLVKKFVNNGQLEFVEGGWCSNDEANVHYTGIIDQMTYGLQKLNETFGECGRPLSAWQIDPFGHSIEQASIYAQMGFDKSLEFLWKASSDLGKAGNIFSGAFWRNQYSPPDNFCFDADCSGDPLVDQKQFGDTSSYNIDARIDDFLASVNNEAQYFRTNNIMLTMGEDFFYRNARKDFINLDRLIEHVNKRQANGSNVQAFYSTPTCYLKALNESGTDWPTKTDDFFPYASETHAYWTGYFTSRPALKGMVRETNNKLQVCKQQQVLQNTNRSVEWMKESMAVLQHHDAVAGTAQQHVTDDYALRLSRGLAQCEQLLNEAARPGSHSASATNHFSFCPLANISICDVSQSNNDFTVLVFNGQSQNRTDVIRLPVQNENYKVTGPKGAVVQSQVTKTFQNNGQVQEESQSGANFTLYFTAELPPLGYSKYFVQKQTSSVDDNDDRVHLEAEPTLSLTNEFIELHFDRKTYRLYEIVDKTSGTTHPLEQDFYFYNGAVGSPQSSGAYVFRPADNTATLVDEASAVVSLVNGTLVQEVRRAVTPWISQVIRLYKDKPFAEFEWTIGPIPVDEASLTGKEIVTRYVSTLNSNATFWTDSNGRQMVKRVRNYQPQYTYEPDEPTSGNYYPVNSRIAVSDGKSQLTILTDRSEGGTSLQDGQIELMLHRRLLVDDGFGVSEPLNEMVDGRGLVVRGRHWLTFTDASKAAALHRKLGTEKFYAPVLTYSAGMTRASKADATFSGLSEPLASNLNVLTLERWGDNEILLRLEHTFQKGDDPKLSAPQTVTLNRLFTSFQIVSAEELTLAANRPASDLSSTLAWFNRDNSNARNGLERDANGDLRVTLNAMEIKTFRCKIGAPAPKTTAAPTTKPSSSANTLELKQNAVLVFILLAKLLQLAVC